VQSTILLATKDGGELYSFSRKDFDTGEYAFLKNGASREVRLSRPMVEKGLEDHRKMIAGR
jgi:hypothetical protein